MRRKSYQRGSLQLATRKRGAGTWFRVGHVVCKRTAGSTGNTWNGSITTTARGSRCTIPDYSATAFQEPLRGGQVAGGEKSRVLAY
jgi:hypothetical protein